MGKHKELGCVFITLPGGGLFGILNTYMVVEDFIVRDTGIYPAKRIVTYDALDRPVTTLEPSGLLIIHAGFICDGASGPTFDRKENRVPGFVHDALYRTIRTGKIILWKAAQYVADNLYGRMCKAAGMFGWWSRVNAWTVRNFGGSSAKPQMEKSLVRRTE